MKGLFRVLALTVVLGGTMGGAAACGEGGDVSIHSLEPQAGALQGSQPVKIHGSNFRTDIGYTVYFGSKKANSVTIMDSETLLVGTPEADEPGAVDIIIAADNGPAWKVHEAFRYEDMSGNVVEKMGEGKSEGSLKY